MLLPSTSEQCVLDKQLDYEQYETLVIEEYVDCVLPACIASHENGTTQVPCTSEHCDLDMKVKSIDTLHEELDAVNVNSESNVSFHEKKKKI